MMTDKELLQQALFELLHLSDGLDAVETIQAIKARLAQPEPPCKTGSQCIGGKCTQCEAQPEPMEWRNAALRLGEDLSTVGPDGYYNMTAKQWLDWALSVTTKIQLDYMQLGACEEKSRRNYINLILGVRVDDASVIIKTKNKDNAKHLCNELLSEKEIYYYPAPPKKELVGLTDEEILTLVNSIPALDTAIAEWWHFARAIEAKLKEKNGN